MTSSSRDLLRQLLPRYFWLRDAEDGGGVLDALLGPLAEEYDGLRLAVDRLYDDLFIATCNPRYVPLIGDDIGVPGLPPVARDRAWVGRVIGLRRRKGMLATIARGTAAATGWAVYVQEGRCATSTTWSTVDPARRSARLVDLEGRPSKSLLHAPWSDVPRGVSVAGRPVVAGAPASPMPTSQALSRTPASVSVSIWRLASFRVRGRTARPAVDAPPHHAGRAFRFDPLGRDTPLFATRALVGDRHSVPRVSELPLPLTNELLAEALRAPSGGEPAPVTVAGCRTLVPGDLREWRRPAGTGEADAIVDPVRGRLLLEQVQTGRLEVSYAYGFAGELGGGPYGFAGDFAPRAKGTAWIHISTGRADSLPTLESALESSTADQDATMLIDDSATYTGPWELSVPAGRELRIASTQAAAPVLDGDIHAHIASGGRLELTGLTISGTLTVHGDGELAIEHCTLVTDGQRPSIAAGGALAITLARAVTGGVEVQPGGSLALRSSIVDGRLAVPGTLDVERATVLGPVAARTLFARDCLFTQPVEADAGLVETSYLPARSRPPDTIACVGPSEGIPRFVSTRLGDPAYCQLHLRSPAAIAAGGSRGGELGAYNWLGQPERFARLPTVLQELLPAGIAATVHYVT